MSQSLCQLYVHLVFSTKNRYPFIPMDRVDILHAYLQTVSKNLEAPTLRVGGVADHVHLLARFPRTLTIAKWVEILKSHSSKWIKSEFASPKMSKFSWQSGYGAFSVSPSHVQKVVAYIQHQEAHHKTETFQEEYRRLLKKYEVIYDERYVWD
jgi:putative transposase